MSDYHLSFTAIEEMPLDVLLDLEVVDSKVEAAFAAKRQTKSKRQVFIDDIL